MLMAIGREGWQSERGEKGIGKAAGETAATNARQAASVVVGFPGQPLADGAAIRESRGVDAGGIDRGLAGHAIDNGADESQIVHAGPTADPRIPCRRIPRTLGPDQQKVPRIRLGEEARDLSLLFFAGAITVKVEYHGQSAFGDLSRWAIDVKGAGRTLPFQVSRLDLSRGVFGARHTRPDARGREQEQE